jgi:hypothetical protein
VIYLGAIFAVFWPGLPPTFDAWVKILLIVGFIAGGWGHALSNRRGQQAGDRPVNPPAPNSDGPSTD